MISNGGMAAQLESLTVDTYRISGLAAGTSTSGAAPVVGNTVTVSNFRSLTWTFLRQTKQDDGTGNIARLEVGAWAYMPGSGPQYQTQGQSIQSSTGQIITTPYTLTAFGDCFVEVVVIK